MLAHRHFEGPKTRKLEIHNPHELTCERFRRLMAQNAHERGQGGSSQETRQCARLLLGQIAPERVKSLQIRA